MLQSWCVCITELSPFPEIIFLLNDNIKERQREKKNKNILKAITDKCNTDHSFRRSIPALLANASNPILSMVLNALVDKRRSRKRFPASHQTLLYCKLTNCTFFVLWFENETLFALLNLFPVKRQIRPMQRAVTQSCQRLEF